MLILWAFLYQVAFAGPNTVTYQGRLFGSSGEPLNSGTVSLTAKILDATGSCLLFQEEHSVNMEQTDGFFQVLIGAGTKETTTAPNFAIQDIFSNSTSFNDANLGCPTPFVPSADEYRILRVSVNGETLTPDQIVGSTPLAFEAMKLGGESLAQVKDHANKNFAGSALPDLGTTPLVAGDSFQWDGSKWVVFQAAPLDLPTNSVSADDLDFASSNGINIPQLSSDPASPTAGQTYYNTTNNKLMVFNGTSWQQAGSGWTASGANVTFLGGNVGIGTASPGQKLSVNGVIESTTGGIRFPDGSVQTVAATPSSGGGFDFQIFTSSGTFVIPTGVTKLKATIYAGGGGGHTNAQCSANFRGGRGGAGVIYLSGLTPGTNIPVTVGSGGNAVSVSVCGTYGGTGGTTSFGSYGSATGGSGTGLVGGCTCTHGNNGGFSSSETHAYPASGPLDVGLGGLSVAGQDGLVVVEW